MRQSDRSKPESHLSPDALTASPEAQAALSRLLTLHPKRIDLSLGRMERVLQQLGDPQDELPPVIHVAGTNGKGSVCAYLRAMAEAAGLTVHVYTSPHLVDFRERIRVSGELIAPDQLVDVLERSERANDGAPITFFEITTAAAFLAFAESSADLVILETGLGGRLDSTNVIRLPAASVITPVDYDHQEFLGDSLASIAREKAGIFKPACPAIIGMQPPEARAALIAEADRIGAPVLVRGEDWDCVEDGRRLFLTGRPALDLPLPALDGAHQKENAALAAAAAMAQNAVDLPPAAIRRGIASARWPARKQKLERGPLADQVRAKGGELWLDGGHNPHAAKAMAADFRHAIDPRPLVLIVGMLNTKDTVGFLSPFAGVASEVLAVAPNNSAAARPSADLADVAQGLGFMASDCGTIEQALSSIHAPSRVLICGSLYLAGEALALNGWVPD
jgi:dihydrofolate synthase / folylpolyglutamate synthase